MDGPCVCVCVCVMREKAMTGHYLRREEPFINVSTFGGEG